MNESSSVPLVTVYFTIVGDNIDLNELSSLLKMRPTEAGKKGDILPGKRRPCRDTFWEVKRAARQHSIDGTIAVLLADFWETREEIMRYIEGCGACIEVLCTVDLFSDGVSCSLSRQTIEKLAFFRAGFDLDISDFR